MSKQENPTTQKDIVTGIAKMVSYGAMAAGGLLAATGFGIPAAAVCMGVAAAAEIVAYREKFAGAGKYIGGLFSSNKEQNSTANSLVETKETKENTNNITTDSPRHDWADKVNGSHHHQGSFVQDIVQHQQKHNHTH